MLILIPVFLIIIGMIAIILEAFIPDAGILAIIGATLILAAIIYAFIKFDFLTGILFFCAGLIGGPLSFIIAFKVFPKSFFGKRIILNQTENPEEGFVSHSDNNYKNLINTTGIAYTPCKPAGIALFDNIKYNVITTGEYIDKNEEIKVIKVEGNKIIIRKK
ncbi:MAG: hypothetical protein JXB50_00795 [Spirochaetes bacterium]|nr:hypothetical protein [Spirochaetota bacterium]